MTGSDEGEGMPTIGRTTKFWVVTRPTELSTLDDICFATGFIGLQGQFAGGLDAKDIMGLWLDRETAGRAAQRLLDLRDAGIR